MVLNKKQEFRFIPKAGQIWRDLTPKTEKCLFPTFQGKTDHLLINPSEKQRKNQKASVHHWGWLIRRIFFLSPSFWDRVRSSIEWCHITGRETENCAHTAHSYRRCWNREGIQRKPVKSVDLQNGLEVFSVFFCVWKQKCGCSLVSRCLNYVLWK